MFIFAVRITNSMNKEIINQPRAIKHSLLLGLSGTPLSIGATLFIKMNKNSQFKDGDTIGDYGISYVQEISPYVNHQSGASQRKAQFKCGRCGSLFDAIIWNVNKGTTKSCGCYALQVKTKHGLLHSRTYRIFYAIIDRCENPKDKGYVNYGGRGIGLYQLWRNNFQLFYNYVSALPHFEEKKYVIDRINNNGNYEPGNLRWATYNISNSNKRMTKRNTSGYIGVSYQKRDNAFISYITIENKRIHIKQSASALIVAKARDEYIKQNNIIGYTLNNV